MAVAEWYAIWTRSNCERLVAQQLEAKGFPAFVPEMSTRSRRNGRSHVVQVPMFPGYLFLRHAMEKTAYVEILKARGIVRILEGGWRRLTPVAEEEVDAITAADPDVVVLASFAEGITLVQELALAGFPAARVVGLDGMSRPDIAEQLFPDDPAQADRGAGHDHVAVGGVDGGP